MAATATAGKTHTGAGPLPETGDGEMDGAAGLGGALGTGSAGPDGGGLADGSAGAGGGGLADGSPGTGELGGAGSPGGLSAVPRAVSRSAGSASGTPSAARSLAVPGRTCWLPAHKEVVSGTPGSTASSPEGPDAANTRYRVPLSNPNPQAALSRLVATWNSGRAFPL
ncbi:hypothetical protein [Sphaerisporangium aureirubrum]|uniref:Uncharacterized protein n=1 Tax=Sphaerisporangium aureirubrum TaxID=1544736 RepID=A0ABW1NN86_9ACTN